MKLRTLVPLALLSVLGACGGGGADTDSSAGSAGSATSAGSGGASSTSGGNAGTTTTGGKAGSTSGSGGTSTSGASGSSTSGASGSSTAGASGSSTSGASGSSTAGASGSSTAGSGGASGSSAAGAGGDAGAAGGAGFGPAKACFAGMFPKAPPIGPDYDQFMPVMGSHCAGTNHQDIQGVERVVFLGDSVTVGTPPTLSTDFYRAKLANALAAKFNLSAPSLLWDSADVVNGVSLQKTSGDFASCAKWGARTDDLLDPPHMQLEDCIPEADRTKRTLIIMTTGGNDIAAITKMGIDGMPIPQIWDAVHNFVDKQRAAIEWVKTPGRFPNGVYVVFANMFEFTDGTGDTTACPAAALAGFGAKWDDVNALADMVIYANEQFLKIAVDTKTDMIFLLETFCGHGFNSGDPNAPCYRGPGTPNWFDISCIHPNPTGHAVISDMFMKVVKE